MQSFYLSEEATRELFEIVRRKGLFLSPAYENGAKPMEVIFAGHKFLCRYWRGDGNGYVALDLLRDGEISLDISDIIKPVK